MRYPSASPPGNDDNNRGSRKGSLDRSRTVTAQRLARPTPPLPGASVFTKELPVIAPGAPLCRDQYPKVQVPTIEDIWKRKYFKTAQDASGHFDITPKDVGLTDIRVETEGYDDGGKRSGVSEGDLDINMRMQLPDDTGSTPTAARRPGGPLLPVGRKLSRQVMPSPLPLVHARSPHRVTGDGHTPLNRGAAKYASPQSEFDDGDDAVMEPAYLSAAQKQRRKRLAVAERNALPNLSQLVYNACHPIWAPGGLLPCCFPLRPPLFIIKRWDFIVSVLILMLLAWNGFLIVATLNVFAARKQTRWVVLGAMLFALGFAYPVYAWRDYLLVLLHTKGRVWFRRNFSKYEIEDEPGENQLCLSCGTLRVVIRFKSANVDHDSSFMVACLPLAGGLGY